MTDMYGPLRAKIAEGWGKSMVGPAPDTGEVGSYSESVLSVAFGDLWNRTHLTVRERRIAVLTVLTLFGRDDITRFHLGSALHCGDLDYDDVEELATTIAVYAGAPRSTTLYLLLEEARNKANEDKANEDTANQEQANPG